jgi:dephospho-CoA kinase
VNPAKLSPDRLSIGLTGGIGSGKTMVANAFAEHGARIIDTDVIARQITAPGGTALPAIEAAFGKNMITPEGAMDRVKMRELVFSDATQKSQLESILHPMVYAEALKQAHQAVGPYIIYVVPLLVESSRWQFSRILVVDCDEGLQVQRVMKRDGLSPDLIHAIMAQQATRTQRLAVATDVLHNQGDFNMLLPEVTRLHKMYVRLSTLNRPEYL